MGEVKNIRLRIEMAKEGIKQWELARALGISESNLSRRLRDELPEEEATRYIKAIRKAKEAKR